jgi:hypothetical protein
LLTFIIMTWDTFQTYRLSRQSAFETLNNQLFERYIRRTYQNDVSALHTVNGSGGDGGIEAYAELKTGEIIAIQSKWFLSSMSDSQIKQIEKSVFTAMAVRPGIHEYIICIPHNVSSEKIGRGKTNTKNHEQNKIEALIERILQQYPDLKVTWWYENELLNQIQSYDNEGVRRYWFERAVITMGRLEQQFSLLKSHNWLKDRYVPELNGFGKINALYNQMIFSESYRGVLSGELLSHVQTLSRCQQLITKFLETQELGKSLKENLLDIYENFNEFIIAITELRSETLKGNELFQVKRIEERDLWPVILELGQMRPTHRQKPILKVLEDLLKEIHKIHLSKDLTDINNLFSQPTKLVKGRPGTGKTQGLAHCVDSHLLLGFPAILIPARSTPCSSWTEILTSSLDLTGWDRNEIFSALESAAIMADRARIQNRSNETESIVSHSKVLICVDGLDEDTQNEDQWRSRVQEAVVLTKNYPRIRFIFSAREYYRVTDNDISLQDYEEITLVGDGDVAVSEVQNNYFEHYKIEISDIDYVRGLDSLLALRLFCDYYRGHKITKQDQLITATVELLRLKIDRLNKDFVSRLHRKKGSTAKPIEKAFQLIAEHFYHEPEIQHSVLHASILAGVDGVLDHSEVNLLLDYLEQNGFVIKIGKNDSSELLPETRYYYQITYQSLIEIILADKIYKAIVAGNETAIPAILHHIPAGSNLSSMKYLSGSKSPNQQIVQYIVNQLFATNGKLIGEKEFLKEGFTEYQLISMQLEAISSAPYDRAISVKDKIDALFFGTKQQQYQVLKHLILPSSHNSGSAFGSEYIHRILIHQPSCFERDKLWSGLDRFERYHSSDPTAVNNYNNLRQVFIELEFDTISLFEWEKVDERPLILAWGLSTLDQSLRSSIRNALTLWAIQVPEEFIKLLDKIFFTNDPQIQEDLSSVALGVARVISDREKIKLLSDWSLNNIFDKEIKYRNVVIRYGFRAIVEKAFFLNEVSEFEVNRARPKQMEARLAPILDMEEILSTTYPIVHDLDSYVINKSYNSFLEYPQGRSQGRIDVDCPEAKCLLDLYRDYYNDRDIYAHEWAVAVARGYIKNTLGLTREQGSERTDATHGSKSDFFTYEEKYTWITVHYLQGYLSDYIPMKKSLGDREWVGDYIQLTDIPSTDPISLDDQLEQFSRKSGSWIIKEDLASTLDFTGDIQVNIDDWVKEELSLNFEKWIYFDGDDFPGYGMDKKWLALYNHTYLHESSEAATTDIVLTACVINKRDLVNLINLIETNPEGLDFLTGLDDLKAHTDASRYIHPADVVWMDWINESDHSMSMYHNYKNFEINHSTVEVHQKSHKEHSSFRIPSKLVRELTGIASYKNKELLDEFQNVVSFLHEVDEKPNHDIQRILLVDHEIISKALLDNHLEICWFAQVFKQKDPLRADLKKYLHNQNARKYLVWRNNEILQSIKFWDQRYSH